MGLSGIGIWQILIVLILILLLFGGKKFRHLGKDLGQSLKDFLAAFRNDSKDRHNDP